MMEIWNEFCSYLIDCRERNVSEERYHEIIESQLSLLNWKRFKGEICHKERIPSGHGFAEPDIVIKKNGEIQMVIEVKKPNHEQTNEERLQLLSYIRLCTLRVGIYIGERIEIFFDQQGNSSEPVSAYKIPIELNCEQGKKFVELMSRDNFTKEEVVNFCEKRIREQQSNIMLDQVRKKILDGEFETVLSDYFKQYLLNKNDYSFSEQQIEDMLSSIQFKVIPKGEPFISEKEVVPSYHIYTFNRTGDVDKNKRQRDKTKYALDNDSYLAKNQFALAVVRKYVRLHPEKTYYELKRLFPDDWQGSMGVIRKLVDISSTQKEERRYYVESYNLLSSKDGLQFAVTTQWNKDNIKYLVNFAKSQGWSVKEKK